MTYWLRTLGFRPGGWLEPIKYWEYAEGRTKGNKSVDGPFRVGTQCLVCNQRSQGVRDNYPGPLIKSVGEPLLYDRTDSWIGEVSLDLLNVVQNEALGKSTEKAGPFRHVDAACTRPVGLERGVGSGWMTSGLISAAAPP